MIKQPAKFRSGLCFWRPACVVLIGALITPLAIAGDADQNKATTADDSAPAKTQLRERADGAEGQHKARGKRKGLALTPEQMQEVLSIIAEIRPELAERITEMHDSHPERISQWVAHFPMIERLYHLKQHDPEFYALLVEDLKLDHQSHLLARKLAKARKEGDEAAAAKLSEQLREAVAAHFVIRQKVRERELQELEERIATLREQLESRGKSQDQLIEKRLTDLTTNSKDRSW